MRKETGLLFKPAMAAAADQGIKTMSRRVINPQPIIDEDSGYVFDGRHKTLYKNDNQHEPWQNRFIEDHCNYGLSGDLLYLKETYYAWGQFVPNPFTKNKKGGDTYFFTDQTANSNKQYKYADTLPDGIKIKKGFTAGFGWYKRTPLFMPKAAARKWFEITGVKAERLQDITKQDAIAEGIQALLQSRAQLSENGILHRDYSKKPELFNEGLKDPFASFRSLWILINGKKSWDANPWVWAISFKKFSR